MKKPKYRIKRHSNGRYTVEIKGWFFWNVLGTPGPHPYLFIKYFNTYKDAEELIEERLTPEWIEQHTKKIMKEYE